MVKLCDRMFGVVGYDIPCIVCLGLDVRFWLLC
jgi:hypothetical protein